MTSTIVQKETLAAWVAKRERYFERMQRLYDMTKSATNVNVFLARYDDIEKYYSTFETCTEEIAALCSKMDPDDNVDTKSSLSSFEDMYFEVKGYVRQHKLAPASTTTAPLQVATSAPPSAPIQPRLPKLEIPPFSGDLKDWSNFYSLFRSTIHRRQDISDVEKLQYLRSLLKGPPLALIENLQITAGSYDIAYQLLCQRYENKRTLGAYYLNAILNFKQLPNDNVTGLRSFLEIFQTNVSAIKNLGISDMGDFLLLQLALRALGPGIKKLFEDKYEQAEFPKFEDLLKFVNKQCSISDLVLSSTAKSVPPVSSVRVSPAMNQRLYHPLKKTYLSTVDSSNSDIASHSQPTAHNGSSFLRSNIVDQTSGIKKYSQNCGFCNQAHYISKCSEFLNLTVPERIEAIKSNRRCFNCLGNHSKSQCRSKSRCQTCHKSHHTLIHESSGTSPPTNHPATSSSASNNVSIHLSTSKIRDCFTVMLGTARMSIIDASGNFRPVRVIVDPGSQVSCITNECVQRLGLRRHKCGVSISGIGDSGIPNNQGAVSCTVAASNNLIVSESVQAVILPRISSKIPSVAISKEVVNRFSNLSLADPEYYKPGPIDFLLGAELYCKILCPNSVIPGEPTAINSTLGWIILGRAPIDKPPSHVNTFLLQAPSLETILQRFWETEEVENKGVQDPEDLVCEEHFQTTHCRDETGRYMVALPFKGNPDLLDHNRQTALRQYNNLEGRLNRNPSLKKEYNDFFSDYSTQQHMLVSSSPSQYVIPHHAVVKETSSTTKVRAVFNASASSSRGQSLNSLLMKGPKLQQDICEIILNFRSHRVVVCADIRQMYRQILIRPEDRKYQHIFWRSDGYGNEVKEYELTTVTYGVTSSAFQAQRVLKQLVCDEGSSYPLASNAVLNHTYIDDILSGGEDINQALQLKEELISLLKLGSFELRKWASNSQELLNTVPLEHCEVPLRQNEEATFKILGLHWQSKTDSFAYYVAELQPVCTKRAILSHVARMFDPLGWLSPVVFWAKHLLQSLWLSKLGWDDNLPPDLREQWQSFAFQLNSLEQIRIPRFIELPLQPIQIIGFCDASSKGYASVIYLAIPNPATKQNKIVLVKAKSKVAPTKQLLSIPRLELCGALLLSRLYYSLLPYFSKLNIKNVTFFSDSNIVLAWLRTEPHLLQTYVANRVVEINKLADNHCRWYHISGSENPCDCASRGLLPQQLVSHPLWWHGPEFLSSSDDYWPSGQGQSVDEIPEMKKQVKSLVVIESPSPANELCESFQKFSKFIKAQRVFAFVRRFVYNCRNPQAKVTGPLQVDELNLSLDLIIRFEQHFYYSSVYKSLNNGTPLKDVALCKLTPFVDEAGLLRVGGRLQHANLPYSRKHPLLLPKASHLSALLCDHFHIQSLHAGPRTVQALVQEKFWIVGIRSLLRQRIFKCLTCYKYASKPSQPLMSDLPAARVASQRPFLDVGVDFGGPFHIKESLRRNAPSRKAYLCLFICFSTKAVHLELVSDLSSAAFLAALDRFVGRRGLPRRIHSDNGTNFTGSARELKEIYDLLQEQNTEITDSLALRHIKWIFNPPTASNFGGLWESGIKSAKYHLRRVIGSQLLTFEEFTTLLCKIEAILNSRPLIDLSPDPSDNIDYLSPGHFLIGTSLLSTPQEDLSGVPLNRLSRWRLIQQASQSFWDLWSTSYLQSLIPRNKWYQSNSSLKVGDLVLLPNLSKLPLHWPMGKIELIHPGKDDVVRVVTVKSGNSSITRPVNKVIPLLI